MNSRGRSRKSIAAAGIALIVIAFGAALQSVDWHPADLFLTPDQHGRLLMAKDAYAEAAKRFRDPMQRGTALYRNADFKEAAAAFGRLDSPEAHYNRGNALLMHGRYDDAIDAYGQALAAKPGWRAAEENLRLAMARKDRMTPPEDDAGGTGGKLDADDIVFDDRAKNAPEDQTETVEDGGLSDQTVQAMWLRRVQTRPADFLRIKFRYQAAVRPKTAGPTNAGEHEAGKHETGKYQ